MAGSSRTMLLSGVLVLCLMTSWSTAQEASSIRLPNNLRPYRYNVTIEPHMYGSNFTFTGNMTFTFGCYNATNQIVLHAKELNVSNFRLTSFRRRTAAPSVLSDRRDADLQFLIITLDSNLIAPLYYSISMTFSAPLNSEPMTGFYLMSYPGPSGPKYMASTQFQSTDARKVFPCMDEPALKAKFLITIIRRTSNTAISNMPIDRSVSLGGDRVADVFETTKYMSTYLVAFAVGDLDHRNATSRRGVLVEAWSLPEVVDQVEYALNYAVRVFDFFEDLFRVQYPLPKLSLLAVPEFPFGAMENWGLIIFNENALLLDPAVASVGDRFWIATIVAHEVAHMWFGNLVTPAWWDDMWLNEGFASFMAYLAMDHVNPEWNVMGDFVTKYLQKVMSIDGGFSSHPIYFTVNTPDEINEHFDAITYFKSASVIRMLRNAVGENTFRDGLTIYLNLLMFTSASRHTLWKILNRMNEYHMSQQQSERNGPIVNVTDIMDTWIMQMNYPIVTVTKQGKRLTFTQQRFLDDRTAADPRTLYGYKWVIPVTYTTSENTDFSNNNIYWLTRDVNLTVTDISLQSDSWVVSNLNVIGYYRVNYDTDNWARLTQQLKSDHTVIGAANRAQIMNDAWTLVKGDYLELSVALGLFEYLCNETDYVPWSAAITELLYIDKLLMGTKIYDAFLAFVRDSMRSIYNQWRITASSEGLTIPQTKLKFKMAHISCSVEVDQCKQDALALFTEWKNKPENNTIDPELREPIYCTCIQFGSNEDWRFLFDLFVNQTNVQERERMRNSLTCTRHEATLLRLLHLALDSSLIKAQERMQVIRWVLGNPVGTWLVWDFVRENWDRIFDMYGEQPFSLSALMKNFGKYFKDETRFQEFQQFVNQTDDFGTASKAVVTVQETIRTNIQWINRNYGPIKHWLQGQGYDA